MTTYLNSNVIRASFEVCEAGRNAMNDPENSDPSSFAARVIHAVRHEAIAQMFVNDNHFVAEVLDTLEIPHATCARKYSHEPVAFDENINPALFSAIDEIADSATTADKISAIGETVAKLAPDAFYREQLAMLFRFMASKEIPTDDLHFSQPKRQITIGHIIIPNVLPVHEPDFDVPGWTVSPYSDALAYNAIRAVPGGVIC